VLSTDENDLTDCAVPVLLRITRCNPTALVRDFVFDPAIYSITVLEVSGIVRDI
jgi:hypothetical protein